MQRLGACERKTAETEVVVQLNLDGSGRTEIQTGIGFFDHMLTLFGHHGLLDLRISATGDLHVDGHHTVEDVGITLGKALDSALGDRAGVGRYGSFTLPMDEALATVALDLSGRSAFVWRVKLPAQKVGTFDVELAREFFAALCANAKMNLHVRLHYGRNLHHMLEAIFKAAARALRQAVVIDPRTSGAVPSTKGVLVD